MKTPAITGRPQSHDWAALTPEDWAALSNPQVAAIVGCTADQAASQRHYRGHPSARKIRWQDVTDWNARLKVIAEQAGTSSLQAVSYQKRKRMLAMKVNVNNT